VSERVGEQSKECKETPRKVCNGPPIHRIMPQTSAGMSAQVQSSQTRYNVSVYLRRKGFHTAC
jgi:hypothetical protein